MLRLIIKFVGAHVSLEHASSVMEAKLASIKPETRFCQTPPLEPWLCDAVDEPVDFSATFDDIQTTLDCAKALLIMDSTRLLNVASHALTKSPS